MAGLTFNPLVFAGFDDTGSSSGSGPSIGGTITGGTNNRILFVHPDSTIAQSSKFLFNTTETSFLVGELDATYTQADVIRVDLEEFFGTGSYNTDQQIQYHAYAYNTTVAGRVYSANYYATDITISADGSGVAVTITTPPASYSGFLLFRGIDGSGYIDSRDIGNVLFMVDDGTTDWVSDSEPPNPPSPYLVRGNQLYYKDGRVGIDKSDPEVELDIVGSIQATGNLSALGEIALSLNDSLNPILTIGGGGIFMQPTTGTGFSYSGNASDFNVNGVSSTFVLGIPLYCPGALSISAVDALEISSATNLVTITGASGVSINGATGVSITSDSSYTIDLNSGGDLSIIAGSASIATVSGGEVDILGNDLIKIETSTDMITNAPAGQNKMSAGGSLNINGDGTAGMDVTGVTYWDFRTTDMQFNSSSGTAGYILQTTGGSGAQWINPLSIFSNPVPQIVSTTSLTTQSAAISSSTMYNTPAAGLYRVSFVASITRAATTSSVLGGANGFQIGYTNTAGKITPVDALTSNAVNSTQSTVSKVILIRCSSGSAISLNFGYTSVGGTTMQYDLYATVEQMY